MDSDDYRRLHGENTSYSEMLNELVQILNQKNKEYPRIVDNPLQESLMESICLDDNKTRCGLVYDELPKLILDPHTGHMMPESPPELSCSIGSSIIHEEIENNNTIDEEYVEVVKPSGTGYPIYKSDEPCCRCAIM